MDTGGPAVTPAEVDGVSHVSGPAQSSHIRWPTATCVSGDRQRDISDRVRAAGRFPPGCSLPGPTRDAPLAPCRGRSTMARGLMALSQGRAMNR